MDVDKLKSRQLYRCGNCPCNRVRDVVEFQVQEDAGAQATEPFHGSRPLGREQLGANLEHTGQIGHLASQPNGCFQALKVERDD